MLNRISKIPAVLSVMIALFVFVALFYTVIMHYNLMHSDVLLYWQESFSWKTPFYEHPPLYSLTIALLRTITFNIANPIVLMMAINLVTFSICIVSIYVISRNFGTNEILAAFAAFLFGLWPFVGLTFTAMPIADSPAFALTLVGLISLQKSRRFLAAFLFSLAIITHKGVWPIIGIITLADFYLRRELLSWRNVAYLGIMLLPLGVLWITGSFYHQSITWMIDRSIRINTTAGGGYPILDGLIGSFQKGGLVGGLKGSVVLFFLTMSIATLAMSYKYKFEGYVYCMAISLGVLLMLLFSSAQTIWGPVRFSKVLAIPLILMMNTRFNIKQIRPGMITWSVVLLLGLFVTQLGFAWYLTIYHLDNL